MKRVPMRFRTPDGYLVFMKKVSEERYGEIIQGYASELKRIGADLQTIQKANTRKNGKVKQ